MVPADVDVETWQHAVASLSATTNLPEVDTKSISDDATAANNLELDYDGTGLTRANSTIGTATAVGSVTGNVGGDVQGNVDGSVGSLGATAKTDVNAEVVDALATDTYAEPGQEAPAATNTLAVKIGYLFKFLRNRLTQTATELKVYADDATTVDQKSTVSDDATTYDRGEIGTGP